MVRYLKLKRYERHSLLFSFCVCLIFIVVAFFGYSLIKKIPNYVLISGVVKKRDVIEVLVTDKDLDILYKNKYVYIEGEKTSYKISNVVLKVLKRKKTMYHDVFISLEFDKNYKENDTIDLVIRNGSGKLISIFKTIWKEM